MNKDGLINTFDLIKDANNLENRYLYLTKEELIEINNKVLKALKAWGYESIIDTEEDENEQLRADLTKANEKIVALQAEIRRLEREQVDLIDQLRNCQKRTCQCDKARD